MEIEDQIEGGTATVDEPVADPIEGHEPIAFDDWSTGSSPAPPVKPAKAPAKEVEQPPQDEPLDDPDDPLPGQTDDAADDESDLLDLHAFGTKIKVTDPGAREAIARLDEKARAWQSEVDRLKANQSRPPKIDLDTATEAEKPAQKGQSPYISEFHQAISTIDELDREQGFGGALSKSMKAMARSIVGGTVERIESEYEAKIKTLQEKLDENDRYIQPTREYEAAYKQAQSYWGLIERTGYSDRDFAQRFVDVKKMVNEDPERYGALTDADIAGFTLKTLFDNPPNKVSTETEEPSASKGVQRRAPVSVQPSRPNTPTQKTPAKTPAGDPLEDPDRRSQFNAQIMKDFFGKVR